MFIFVFVFYKVTHTTSMVILISGLDLDTGED